jgi:hypothetical protein
MAPQPVEEYRENLLVHVLPHEDILVTVTFKDSEFIPVPGFELIERMERPDIGIQKLVVGIAGNEEHRSIDL